MLFDLEDYVRAGIIGPDQQPMNSEKWQDCKTTFAATRDSSNVIINQWLDASNICSDAKCETARNSLTAEYSLAYTDLYETGEIFWDSLINSTYTKQIHKNYSDAIEKYMSIIRRLLILIDTDRLTIQ